MTLAARTPDLATVVPAATLAIVAEAAGIPTAEVGTAAVAPATDYHQGQRHNQRRCFKATATPGLTIT